MPYQLHYGRSHFHLETAPDVQVARYRTRGEPLDNLRAEVAAALAEPLNYPPLQLASTPGDRVTLAIDWAIPGVSEIVAGAVETLLRGGVEPSDITVLVAGSPSLTPALDDAGLPAAVRASIHVEWHDPRNRKGLAYLAATSDGDPIYLNRHLVDADVVVPISEVSLESALGYLGVHGGLYPRFSDEATIKRFRDPAPPEAQHHQQILKQQCDEVAWLLGALFAIQVVPGPLQSVLHVLAGETSAVERRGQQLASEAWTYEPPFRASLVVATISGDQPHQSWRNFSRALHAATQAAADNSDIVLCTELDSVPSRSVAFGRPSHDYTNGGIDSLEQETLYNGVLAAARQRARVYLLSHLESDVVEELGLGYVSDANEIQRLSRRHPTWLLLEDAQHAVVRARR